MWPARILVRDVKAARLEYLTVKLVRDDKTCAKKRRAFNGARMSPLLRGHRLPKLEAFRGEAKRVKTASRAIDRTLRR